MDWSRILTAIVVQQKKTFIANGVKKGWRGGNDISGVNTSTHDPKQRASRRLGKR